MLHPGRAFPRRHLDGDRLTFVWPFVLRTNGTRVLERRERHDDLAVVAGQPSAAGASTPTTSRLRLSRSEIDAHGLADGVRRGSKRSVAAFAPSTTLRVCGRGRPGMMNVAGGHGVAAHVAKFGSVRGDDGARVAAVADELDDRRLRRIRLDVRAAELRDDGRDLRELRCVPERRGVLGGQRQSSAGCGRRRRRSRSPRADMKIRLLPRPRPGSSRLPARPGRPPSAR